MLTVAEARTIVLQHSRPGKPAPSQLGGDVLGQILAEDVVSDLDMPPYDKALMDGYAVRTADFASGAAELLVVEEVRAGQVPSMPIGPGQATRIMTGAPIPAGADAVIPVEQSQPIASQRAAFAAPPRGAGWNILTQGREMRRGEVVLRSGSPIRPQELGLLAAVGRTEARLFPRPQVAILSTGDEIVEAPAEPGPGQIRNSNGPLLAAQVARAGGAPDYLGIAGDNLPALRDLVVRGLQAPVLILSGGVSMGKLDLVPQVLQEEGVIPHFHKVAMKPGKPVFFGTRGKSLVFGLPGNPVSAYACFELFVRAALRIMLGHSDPGPRIVQAVIAEDFKHVSDRETYFPARLDVDSGQVRVRPVAWFGSPDLRALASANALLVLKPGTLQIAQGDRVDVLQVETI